MATLAQLKTAIILKLDRDDMGTAAALEQALADAIDRSIEKYADERFWFNRTSGSGNTTGAVATINIPSGLRTVERVMYSGEDLVKASLADIQGRTETGQPTHWAETDGTITLWPIPDAAYTLVCYGLAELGTPASGASNAWTTDALDLIDASARVYLYSGYLRDVEGALLADQQESRALSKLRRESRRKATTPLRTDVPAVTGGRFNINRGY